MSSDAGMNSAIRRELDSKSLVLGLPSNSGRCRKEHLTQSLVNTSGFTRYVMYMSGFTSLYVVCTSGYTMYGAYELVHNVCGVYERVHNGCFILRFDWSRLIRHFTTSANTAGAMRVWVGKLHMWCIIWVCNVYTMCVELVHRCVVYVPLICVVCTDSVLNIICHSHQVE